MAKTIGIDLGTTNTVVAVLQDGRPRVLEDDKGYKVLPSVVSWKGDERYTVGQPAKNLVLTQPDRTVYAAKRLLGRRYDSPEVVQAMKRMAYRIEPAEDGNVQLGVGEMVMTPIEVSAIILSVARQIATRALGEPVNEAVITVPAYFNHAQRSATMEAAQIAGLRCDRLLNEPTAAALAYGYRKDVEKTLVIYDLGGGTFDVSVLHMSHGIYEILSTSGDTFLGGEDIDYLIVDHLADEFQRRERIDLRKDPVVVQRLKDAAERTKCQLSFTDTHTVLVPRIIGDKNLEMQLSRSALERLANDLIMRTVEITREAISAAGLQTTDIDDVILVGGQTRMPRVREVITNLFGREPSRSVHPEEVVAIGAAVHAESLDDPESSQTLLIDVTPFDLGIDAAGGFFSPIIERNSKLPITQTRTFTTVTDNQDKVRITVRQGESRDSTQNEFLGEFVLTNLRPAPRMSPKLDVTFRIDANGMLHVTATERATGERQQIVVRNYADVAAGSGAAPDAPGRVEMSELEDGVELAPVPVDGKTPHASQRPGFLKRLLGGLSKKREDGTAPPAIQMPIEEGQEPIAPPDIVPPVLAPPGMPSVPMELGAGDMVELEPEALDASPMELGAGDMIALEPEPLDGLSSLGSDEVFAMPDEDSALSGMPADSNDEPFAMPDDDDEIFAMPDDDEFAMPDDEPFAMPDDDFAKVDDSFVTSDDTFTSPPDDALFSAADELLDSIDSTSDDLLGDAFDPDLLDGGASNSGEQEALDFLSELGVEGDLLADLGLSELGAPSIPEPSPEPPRPPRRKRRPAKLKISYRRVDTFLREYGENLANGGAFIKTPKPLPTGRECVFLISIPDLDEPISFRGEVVWSSRDEAVLNTSEAGMRVKYTFTEQERLDIQELMAQLAG